MEATECGAASLSMIFAYFGKHLTLEQLRTETGVSRDGCNAGNIMRCAKKHGLDCRGYQKKTQGLRSVALPCIIFWDSNHFVVFEGFRGKYAYLNDPAVGRRRLTWEELDEGFAGVVITFKPTDRFEKEKKKRAFPAFARERLKGQYGTLIQLFHVGLLLIFPGLLLPALSRVFIDDILLAGSADWLTGLLAAMAALVLLRAGLTYYRSRVLQRLRSKLTLISGSVFLQHMMRLPMSFFDQRHAGDLVERMESNTRVNEFLAGDLAETALNMLVSVIYFFVLLYYSPVMTAVGMLEILVCLGTVAVGDRLVSGAAMKLQLNGGRLFSALCAGLGSTDTIKAAGAEAEYAGRIMGWQARQANMEQELGRCQQIAGAIPDAAGKITDALLLLTGGLLVIRGRMTPGMLAAFGAMFDAFADPVKSLAGFFRRIQTMKADVSRVEDIVRYAPDERFGCRDPRAPRTRKLSGDIELRDVSFGYSTLKPPLVRDFSFHLHSGESIAFVGASGSGKSTAAKIVSGLYRPWTGEVLADGVPVSEIPPEVLSASISTVSQNIVLFSGTIRDNLKLWNPAILEEDMIAAAKDACIHDFIMQQKDGYDHRLAENAANVSGGQRQRLEIARALAAKPTVLILDEATSALDPIVEKQILDNIKRRGCTCVIVAHRLSAIRDCSQIVVMDQGRIVQRGVHRTLQFEEGKYRDLVRNL